MPWELAKALGNAGLAFGVLGGAGAPGGDNAADEDASRLVIVPVTLAKGLEFDHVVLAEPARIAAASGEAYGLRRLYVALTRAVSRLTVLHAEAIPNELLLRTMDTTHEKTTICNDGDIRWNPRETTLSLSTLTS